MEVQISGRHLEITPPIREYAQTKSQRLRKYYDRISEISIVVDSQDTRFGVEMIISIDRNKPVVAHAQGDDLYAGIDKVTEKAERQLTDLKERFRNRKHHTG